MICMTEFSLFFVINVFTLPNVNGARFLFQQNIYGFKPLANKIEVDMTKFKGNVLLIFTVSTNMKQDGYYRQLEYLAYTYSNDGLRVLAFLCNQLNEIQDDDKLKNNLTNEGIETATSSKVTTDATSIEDIKNKLKNNLTDEGAETATSSKVNTDATTIEDFKRNDELLSIQKLHQSGFYVLDKIDEHNKGAMDLWNYMIFSKQGMHGVSRYPVRTLDTCSTITWEIDTGFSNYVNRIYQIFIVDRMGNVVTRYEVPKDYNGLMSQDIKDTMETTLKNELGKKTPSNTDSTTTKVIDDKLKNILTDEGMETASSSKVTTDATSIEDIKDTMETTLKNELEKKTTTNQITTDSTITKDIEDHLKNTSTDVTIDSTTPEATTKS